MTGRPLKRSFSLDGHRTSVSLEQPFWQALQEIALAEGVSLAALVQRIDRERGVGRGAAQEVGLSGAVRVHILRYYQTRAGASVVG